MAPETTPPGGATRYIQTTRGLLSYSQLAPLLAERVLLVERSIAAGTFGAGGLSPDLILEFHREIVGDLCPEWAGRWRDVEVRVTQRHSAAKPQANYAKRLECAELAPAFAPRLPYDSASKLDPLQTLRVAVHPQKAKVLREKIDARLAADPKANLVVLGDFNDTKAVNIITTTQIFSTSALFAAS